MKLMLILISQKYLLVVNKRSLEWKNWETNKYKEENEYRSLF